MFEAICQDIYGNSINGFTQWDINQEIFIKIEPCGDDHIEEDYLKIYPEVHFSNIKREKALVVKASSTLGNNIIQVKVPNILLTEPYPLLIYVYYTSSKDSSAQSTIVRTELPIRKRDEPHDYNYVENIERITAEQIKEEVEQDTEKTRTTAISEIGSHKDTALTEIDGKISEYIDTANGIKDAMQTIHDNTKGVYNEALEIVANARNEIKFIGLNPIKSPDEDTVSNWNSFGTGFAYVNTAGYLVDQPATYGFIESYVYGSLVKQIWHTQSTNGSIYKRAGNADGWYDSWSKVFDDNMIIPVENGGTGLSLKNAPAYSIIRANSDPSTNSNLYYQPTKSGAFYATSENGAPKFGTLPIEQGGTGATTRAEALNKLGISWGASAPPPTGEPNTIYIQIN